MLTLTGPELYLCPSEFHRQWSVIPYAMERVLRQYISTLTGVLAL